MPFDFVFFGLCFIFTLFFIKHNIKYVYLISNLLLLLSYFTGRINFKTYSINILTLGAILLLIFYLLLTINKRKLLMFFSSCFMVALIYLILIKINIYNLIIFNYLPILIFILVFITLLKDSKSCILFSLLSGVLIELVSYFISLSHFDYYTFFSANFYKILAFNFILIALKSILIKTPIFRRKKSFNIVLCDTEEKSCEE